MVLKPLDARQYPPSEACLAYMAANDYAPDLPVYRAMVTPEFMARTKLQRPEIANTVQLLTGPFGLVRPTEGTQAFRIAELQVGDIVINVEAEYDD